MKYLRRIIYTLICVMLFFSFNTMAEGDENGDKKKGKTKSIALCVLTEREKKDEIIKGIFEINKPLCWKLVDYKIGGHVSKLVAHSEVVESLEEYKNETLNFIKEKTGNDYGRQVELISFIEYFYTQVGEKIENPDSKTWPQVKVGSVGNSGIGLSLGSAYDLDQRFNLPSREESRYFKERVDSEFESCEAPFEKIADGLNGYRIGYDEMIHQDNIYTSQVLEAHWDKYDKKARVQTLLDLMADDSINKWRGHYKDDHLVGPPKTQYFFLHPTLIYEWIEEEPDGSKDKASLALEIFGFNRWDARMPWGASFTLVGSDRINFDPVSPAVSFYLFNKYSFGFSFRNGKNGFDDEVGFYVNFDLLSFGRETKKGYDRHIEKLSRF